MFLKVAFTNLAWLSVRSCRGNGQHAHKSGVLAVARPDPPWPALVSG